MIDSPPEFLPQCVAESSAEVPQLDVAVDCLQTKIAEIYLSPHSFLYI